MRIGGAWTRFVVMTTRKAAALALCYRRTFPVAIEKYSGSLEARADLVADVLNQVSWFSTTVLQCRKLARSTFCCPIPAQHDHVAIARRAVSQIPAPGLSDWSMFSVHGKRCDHETTAVSIVTRALTQIREMGRTFCSEALQKREGTLLLLDTSGDAVEGRDVLGQKVESKGNSSNVFLSSLPGIDNARVYHRLVQMRHYSLSTVVEGGRWMPITGRSSGFLAVPSIRHPFAEGGVRFKSRNKMKRAKAKKKETLSKIKRMRVISNKRKEEMTPEERLEFRIEKGRKKIELIKVAIAKFPVQEIPPEDPDFEVLTPEQMHYLKKIGYKNKNYVPVGRRGIYGGTIQNMHMHWKKHETVQVEIAGFSPEEIKVMAVQLARLSGGMVVDIHQKNIVILYRGRNYKMPKVLIPMKTLDKRKALAKSVLEQSMKALILNDKKIVLELAALRKENELMQSGELPVSAGDGALVAKRSKWRTEVKLEDPDEYSEPNEDDLGEHDEIGELSEVGEIFNEDDGDEDNDSLAESKSSQTSEWYYSKVTPSRGKVKGSAAKDDGSGSDFEGFTMTELWSSSDSDVEDEKAVR